MQLAGVTIQRFGREEAMAAVVRAAMDHPVRVMWVYANCLNVAQEDRTYRDAVKHAEFVFNDGAGIELAGKVLGRRVLENLIGTDWIPDFVDFLAKTRPAGFRIFLLGSRPEVAPTAAARFADRWPMHQLVGWSHGFHEDLEMSIRQIEKARPELLIVGMGVPRQEVFLYRHWDRLQEAGIRYALAGGAILDHFAGVVPRAPQWIRKMRCEWIYRLLHEPRRLWRRYLLGNLRFLVLLLREKLGRTPPSRQPDR